MLRKQTFVFLVFYFAAFLTYSSENTEEMDTFLQKESFKEGVVINIALKLEIFF